MTYLHTHELHDPIRVILENNNWLELLGNIVAILFAGFVIWYSMRSYKATRDFNDKTLNESKKNNEETLKEIKKYNKLSLRPILDTTLKEISYKNLKGWEYVLQNGGLGPAFIESLIYTYDGKEYKTLVDQLIRQCEKEVFKFIIGTETKDCLFRINSIIKSGDEIMLFKIINGSGSHFENTRALFRKVKISIKYKGLYDFEDTKTEFIDITN